MYLVAFVFALADENQARAAREDEVLAGDNDDDAGDALDTDDAGGADVAAADAVAGVSMSRNCLRDLLF